MDRDDVRLREVLEFLAGETTVALATVSADGKPHVTPLFYLAREGPRLFWFSAADSRHSRNLKENPRAAATVYHHTAEWKAIRGLQIRGSALPVTDPALRRAVAEPYTERFELGALFEAAISQSTLYCFEADWLRYIDNSRGFGFKFEISLG